MTKLFKKGAGFAALALAALVPSMSANGPLSIWMLQPPDGLQPISIIGGMVMVTLQAS